MFSKLLIAWLLTGLCVFVHAVGMTALLRWLRTTTARRSARFWLLSWWLIQTAGWIILLHLVEIAAWAFFYTWENGLPDLQTAFYFSAVTYTTTGYGDVLLPNEWRVAGGIEALTGILMCGWSAAFFFAVVTRINEMRFKSERI